MIRTKLRQSAKDETCTLRFPGCHHENPVLCHLPHPDKGMGVKGPDEFAVYGCDHCHAILDRRDMSQEVDWQDVLRALAETQKRMKLKGLMIV